MVEGIQLSLCPSEASQDFMKCELNIVSNDGYNIQLNGKLIIVIIISNKFIRILIIHKPAYSPTETRYTR